MLQTRHHAWASSRRHTHTTTHLICISRGLMSRIQPPSPLAAEPLGCAITITHRRAHSSPAALFVNTHTHSRALSLSQCNVIVILNHHARDKIFIQRAQLGKMLSHAFHFYWRAHYACIQELVVACWRRRCIACGMQF